MAGAPHRDLAALAQIMRNPLRGLLLPGTDGLRRRGRVCEFAIREPTGQLGGAAQGFVAPVDPVLRELFHVPEHAILRMKPVPGGGHHRGHHGQK